MSDSLQQLNRAVCYLLLLLITLEQTSAYTIEANPYHLDFEVDPSKRSCKEVAVSSDFGNLEVETWWSMRKSKQLEEYRYTAEQIEIEVTVPEKIIKQKDKVKICIKIDDNYAYNGVLLFISRERGASVGVWITINQDRPSKELIIEKTDKKSSNRISLTGNVISEETLEREYLPKIILVELGAMLLLLAILIGIATRRKEKPKAL